MTLVVNGVTFTVSNGQTVTSATVVNDGEIYVMSGGTIVDTVVEDSSVALVDGGGTAVATTLANNGYQDVYGTATPLWWSRAARNMSLARALARSWQAACNTWGIAMPYSDGTVVDDRALKLSTSVELRL